MEHIFQLSYYEIKSILITFLHVYFVNLQEENNLYQMAQIYDNIQAKFTEGLRSIIPNSQVERVALLRGLLQSSWLGIGGARLIDCMGFRI